MKPCKLPHSQHYSTKRNLATSTIDIVTTSHQQGYFKYKFNIELSPTAPPISTKNNFGMDAHLENISQDLGSTLLQLPFAHSLMVLLKALPLKALNSSFDYLIN